MGNHPVIPIVPEDETLQEESTMLLDESELSIKKDKVSRRKFSNINKTVILIRANPDDWTESDRIRVGTPNSLMAIGAVLKDVNIPVEIIDFSVLTEEEEVVALGQLPCLLAIPTQILDCRRVNHFETSCLGLGSHLPSCEHGYLDRLPPSRWKPHLFLNSICWDLQINILDSERNLDGFHETPLRGIL